MIIGKRQSVIKLILFGLVFLLLLTVLSAAVDPVKWFEDQRIQDRNARLTQLREEAPDTIEIMNMGDSLSQSGISPMEMWRQSGYTSFNIGADGIRMAEMYYGIKAACREQTPSDLLIEGLALFRYTKSKDEQMVLSQPLYYTFDFLKYHNLWKSFIEGPGVRIYHKGYLINRIQSKYKGNLNYLDEKAHNDWLTEVPEENRVWFEKIRKFCDEKGIRIILYAMPSPKNYTWKRVNSLQSFADEEGVEFVDLNSRCDEIGIDWDLDTSDRGDHLNLNGAIKVTKYLGDRLSEYGDLTDFRHEPDYKDWDEEIVAYDKLVDEMEGISFYYVQLKRDEERREKKERDKKK